MSSGLTGLKSFLQEVNPRSITKKVKTDNFIFEFIFPPAGFND
jgi:hypothetical protein